MLSTVTHMLVVVVVTVSIFIRGQRSGVSEQDVLGIGDGLEEEKLEGNRLLGRHLLVSERN